MVDGNIVKDLICIHIRIGHIEIFELLYNGKPLTLMLIGIF